MNTAVGVEPSVTEDLLRLAHQALGSIDGLRGAEGLVADVSDLLKTRDLESTMQLVASSGGLLVGRVEGRATGLALASPGPSRIVLAAFVEPSYRRRGLGSALLAAALALDPRPTDAWVLPGDRASKSLYERAGWRARRLTMSGD